MISLKNIRIAFDANKPPILDSVSFDLEPGRRVALLGANGSGKSSLMWSIMGFLLPGVGEISVDGLNPLSRDEVGLVRPRLGFVGQKPEDAITSTTVEAEVAFGPENLGLPREEIRRRVDEALEQVGLADLKLREPASLSGGQKQRLVMAGALAMKPNYLLLDEPCSMLDPDSREQILSLIADAQAQGLGIIHITHDLSEVKDADEIIVLAGGGVAFRGSFEELLAHEAKFAKWGISNTLPPVTRAEFKGDSTAIAYELKDVGLKYDLGTGEFLSALEGVDLKVRAGDFTVISGKTGSGKSTLLRILAGALEATSGSAKFFEMPIELKNTRGKVGLIFQHPEQSFFAETVKEEIAFGPRAFGKLDEEIEPLMRESMAAVDLDFSEFAERFPFTLSGGQARKLAIASILALKPLVILADEPTAGLDAPSRDTLRELFGKLAAHASIFVVTHHPEEFESLATRRLHIADKRVEECA